ncbi:hypothetical protein [Nocardioides solisilvae]|uniref:hypothetical protein n=1 Tax=Nocardioides solisilvae TaxID=1542435 RepID=UPI0013A5AFE1|nr:hypothetical protein [Nocardioides solisilvae]
MRRRRASAGLRPRATGAMLVLVLGGIVGGCGDEPDAETSRASLEESRAQVEQRFGEAVEALTGAGFEVVDGGGRWVSCQMEPASAMEFSAGASVNGGSGDDAARVRAAADAVAALGWESDAAAETPRPYANFVDGDLRLSVSKSKIKEGLSFSVTGPCIESTTDQENELLGTRVDLP